MTQPKQKKQDYNFMSINKSKLIHFITALDINKFHKTKPKESVVYRKTKVWVTFKISSFHQM